MRQSTIITAVVLCLITSSASFAGNKDNNQNKSQNEAPKPQKVSQPMTKPAPMQAKPAVKNPQQNKPNSSKPALQSAPNKQVNQANKMWPVPNGNGSSTTPNPVPTTPSPVTPPARPGFVWAGDHWERARAPKPLGPPPVANGGGGVTVTPANSGPVVHDHRPGATVNTRPVFGSGSASTRPPVANGGGGVTVTPANNGPVIHDHRPGATSPILPGSTPGFGSAAGTPPPAVLNPVVQPSGPRPVGRPRPSSPNGGVTVTAVPGSQRPNDVTGVGGSPIDSAIDSVINIFQGGGITPVATGRR